MAALTEAVWLVVKADDDGPAGHYEPALQTAGCCFGLGVWFSTPEACEAFIRDEILPAPFEP